MFINKYLFVYINMFDWILFIEPQLCVLFN